MLLSSVHFRGIGVALLACLGCSSVQQPEPSGSLLSKPRMASDSVSLDIFSVRLPENERRLYEAIWSQIDEQPLPIETRRRLAENGFRVGLVGAQLPDEVQRLLELSASPEIPTAAGLQGGSVVRFDGSSEVRIRHLQLRDGWRAEIIASGLYDSLAVFERDDGKVHGRMYEMCQAILAIRPRPQGDGRVQLEIVPEMHFGADGQRPLIPVAEKIQGVWRMPTGRPRKVFAQLAITATLAPGEMIAISAFPDREGSLGHSFCTTEDAGKRVHKLLLIRVAQTQLDDLFSDTDADAP